MQVKNNTNRYKHKRDRKRDIVLKQIVMSSGKTKKPTEDCTERRNR